MRTVLMKKRVPPLLLLVLLAFGSRNKVVWGYVVDPYDDAGVAMLKATQQPDAAPAAATAAASRSGAAAVGRTAVPQFSTLIGSALIGPTYQFTSDPLPLEGAKRMLAAGATVHKFRLLPLGGGSAAAARLNVTSLLDAATRPELGFAELFDLPFRTFVFWSYPANETDAYRETYDLVGYERRKEAPRVDCEGPAPLLACALATE